MINAELHFLTNRSRGFTYPGFHDNPSFVPLQETEAQRFLHKILRLDNDYYARAVLHAMNLAPGTRDVLDSPRTYRTDIAFEDDFSTLVASREPRHNYIWSDPAEDTFPVNLSYTLVRPETGTMLIKYNNLNTKESFNITEALTTNNVTYYEILHADPDQRSRLARYFGVRGSFVVGSSGAINITYHPKRFPYIAAAAVLRANYENILEVLSKPGMETTFLAEENPIHVVAIAGAALTLSRLHV
jgi:hypothetical protein